MVNREIRAWLHLDHINVLPLFGTTMGFGPFPAMVCPWLENGSLTSYLERRNDTLTKVERLTLLGDVAAGLQYCRLHSQFVVHGDLSGSNVLIDDKGRARISDFGLLTLLAELETPTFETSIPRKRTLRWAAPELLGASGGGVNPSPQSDVYSFGGIMLQILTGKVPYHYLVNDAPVVLAIRKGETPKRPSEDLVTDRQWAFMQRCWTPATVARPSGEEIVEFVRRELVLTTHRGTQPQGPKDEGKDVGEKGEGEHLPAPGSPEDTYINTHPQGPKDDAEGENVEEDRFPNELSWLRDVLKVSLPSR
ncbi:hypothetical protein PAXINDRAFT_90906 [Paxillus involutus ATCC 200175]|uniref:Protein kinase domain-containing protein n=1 Tax=Paxillus involutus ATCC 200175 TaxID=664439 RepID=A0A0C9SWG4_PAXIN|nr:hypothetical protein PAXINDRAFT_90906 [Paxillus involutus ATCC 200175]